MEIYINAVPAEARSEVIIKFDADDFWVLSNHCRYFEGKSFEFAQWLEHVLREADWQARRE